MHILRLSVVIFFSVCAFFSLSASASQKDIDAERDHFMSIFTADNLEAMRGASRELQGKYSSDPMIFDLIAKRIKERQQGVINRDEVDSVAWMVRALGFSGNSKYIETLNDVTANGNDKLKRHAKSALKDLNDYAKWNPVASKDLDKAPDGRLDQQRALNLIRSGDSEIVYEGLDLVYDHFTAPPKTDKVLLDEVKAMLLLGYENAGNTKAVTLMCKILIRSGTPEYLAVVREVDSKTSNGKLKKYLDRALLKAGTADDVEDKKSDAVAE